MHVYAAPLIWLALPIHLAVGVALWRGWPSLRDIFCEAGYVGGMILTAFIWPFMLVQMSAIMVIVFVFSLFANRFRLFRRKPGGRLVITDADTHEHEWLRTEQHDRWLGFDRADIARWFGEAGLLDVSVIDTTELCCPTSECCGAKAAITIFLARGVKPAD